MVTVEDDNVDRINSCGLCLCSFLALLLANSQPPDLQDRPGRVRDALEANDCPKRQSGDPGDPKSRFHVFNTEALSASLASRNGSTSTPAAMNRLLRSRLGHQYIVASLFSFCVFCVILVIKPTCVHDDRNSHCSVLL